MAKVIERLEALQAWAEARPTRMIITATVTFLLAGALVVASSLLGDWGAFTGVLQAILAVPLVLSLLVGYLAAGAWVSTTAESTWRQRLALRTLPDRVDAPTGDRRESLIRLSHGKHAASDILVRGRLLTWTGAAVAFPGGFTILAIAGAFDQTPDPVSAMVGLLFPLALLGLFAFLRGFMLLQDGRRLVRDLDPKPAKPTKAAKATKRSGVKADPAS